MATVFLSNIGNSSELRKQISQTDLHNTVSLILDKPRTLEVRTKNFGRNELTVRCKDVEERVSIVLHLPFQEGAVASATIIDYTTESTST